MIEIILSFIVILFIIVLILCIALLYWSLVLICSFLNPLLTYVVPIVEGIISGVIASLLTLAIITQIGIKFQLKNYLESLLHEINHNSNQLEKFNDILDRTKKYWLVFKSYELAQEDWRSFDPDCGPIGPLAKEKFGFFEWINPKSVCVIPNQRKWFYQYLSDNSFNAFISSNYFQYYIKWRSETPDSKNYINNLSELEKLKRYYSSCIRFSDETQFIEDLIDEVSLYVKDYYRNEIDSGTIKINELYDKVRVKLVQNRELQYFICDVKTDNEYKSIIVLRMPLYFNYLLNQNRSVKYDIFVENCYNAMKTIFNQKNQEIQSSKDQVLNIGLNSLPVSDEAWVHQISHNVESPPLNYILQCIYEWIMKLFR